MLISQGLIFIIKKILYIYKTHEKNMLYVTWKST